MDSGKFSKNAEPKKAYRFNIIDFMLILIIAAAVALLVYVMLGNNILKGDDDSIILYTIEIPLIKNDFLPPVEGMMKGEKIIDSVRTNELGVVQDVKITDAVVLSTNLETGIIKETPYPNFSKVVITVRSECKIDKPKFVVNGANIMVGISINFRTPYLVSYGYITSLVEIDEEGNVINE